MSSFLESCFQEHYPFYSKLTADEQQTLVLSSVLTTYQRGDFLYSCDDDCLGVLLVLSGKLRIFIQSGEQRAITQYTTGHGKVCTLSASCAMQEISFDILIEAEEETKVLITPASTFRRLMNQNIYVENYIYRDTTEHISEVMWAMGQLLFTRLDQRLAGYLEDERIRNGSRTNLALPAPDTRDTCTGFERTVLSSAKNTARSMVSQQFYCLILVSVVHYRTVIAGKNH